MTKDKHKALAERLYNMETDLQVIAASLQSEPRYAHVREHVLVAWSELVATNLRLGDVGATTFSFLTLRKIANSPLAETPEEK